MEISIFQWLTSLHGKLRRISGANYWQILRARARCPRTCLTNNGRVEEQVVAFTAVRGGGLGGGRNLLPRKMRFGPGISGTVFEREGKRSRGRRGPARRDKLDARPYQQGRGRSNDGGRSCIAVVRLVFPRAAPDVWGRSSRERLPMTRTNFGFDDCFDDCFEELLDRDASQRAAQETTDARLEQLVALAARTTPSRGEAAEPHEFWSSHWVRAIFWLAGLVVFAGGPLAQVALRASAISGNREIHGGAALRS